MGTDEVMKLLSENANPRGMANWAKMDQPEPRLESFGIGLTVLRKLAKKIGRDHELAGQLWALNHYDARVIALLIDDPKQLTRERAEAQVDHLAHGMLSHVFSSCDATLAKTQFAADLALEWRDADDEARRRSAYGLFYELSKSKKKSAPSEEWFLDQLTHIRQKQAGESRQVRMSMGGAVMGIGKRTVTLNAAAIVVADEMGPIPGEPGCDAMDFGKHLKTDYIRKKLGIA